MGARVFLILPLIACSATSRESLAPAAGLRSASAIATDYLEALGAADIDRAVSLVRADDRDLERLAWEGNVTLAPEEVLSVASVEELVVVNLDVRGPDPTMLLECVFERSNAADVVPVIEACADELPSAERPARVVLSRDEGEWRVVSVNALTRRMLVLLEQLEATTDVAEHRALERRLRALRERLAFVAGPTDPAAERALERRLADPIGSLAAPEPEPEPQVEIVSLADRIERRGPGRYRIDVRGLDLPLEAFTYQARFVPAFEEGNVVGIRISGIRPGSVFGNLGVHNGDLFTAFNGEPIRSAEAALAIWEAVQDATMLTFSFEREAQVSDLVLEMVR